MAKQTFTTGQVLTAAQMTSLQQTAMGGGSATAKTASYVLVAADAGTVVAMNAAESTTITVNTGLFSAGDTVFIQNWGAGTCTVTAGTATVSTHGSLALGQYEGGTLYFTSASAAIFFDISQTSGMTNPMTTTGDTIYSSSGSTPARLGIGSTGQVLTVSGGLPVWATPSSGSGGMTLLSTTTLSGSTTTISSISQSYKNLFIIVNGITNNTGTTEILFQPNSITDIVTSMNGAKNDAGSPLYFTGSEINAKIRLCRNGAGFANTNNNNEIVITIFDYASSVNKVITLQSAHIPYTTSEKTIINSTSAIFNTSAITSVNFSNTNGYTYSAGTVYIYGVS